MKNRILFLLFLIIPISLLVWFAIKTQSNEQLAAQQNYQNLAHSQLRLIDEKIINYFKQLEASLIAKSPQLVIESPQRVLESPQRGIKSTKLIINQEQSANENYANKIRQFLKYSPYILNVYISDTDQKTLYPLLTQKLSESEQSFIENIQIISRNKTLFNAQKETENTSNQDNRSFSCRRKSAAFKI